MLVDLDRTSHRPLYTQIRDQIKETIINGYLPRGFKLPSERKLALSLGVNRTTVVNAYNDLDVEGFIVSKIGSGRIVAYPSNNEPQDNRRDIPWNILINRSTKNIDNWALETIQKADEPDGNVISFVSGAPSSQVYACDTFKEIVSRILNERASELLCYSPPGGLPDLTEELSRWMNSKGICTASNEVMIVDGCQQGIFLIADVLIEPGDVVVLPQPGYLGAIQAFTAAGAKIVGVDINEDGICIDALKSILRHYRPKLIYAQPNFQNPSGISMSLDNRQQLLKLSYKYGIPIVEDDPYGDLRYIGSELPSLKALEEKRNVISIGSFSKILYPGLRIGWIVAPKHIIKYLKLVKRRVNLHTNTFSQYVILEYFKSQLLNQHLERVKKEYSIRAKAMTEALRGAKLERLNWYEPNGGYFVWLQLLDGIDTNYLLKEAYKEGVTFVPGKAFCLTGGENCLRLSFASTPPEIIKKGIKRLANSIDEARDKLRHNNSGFKNGSHEEIIL